MLAILKSIIALLFSYGLFLMANGAFTTLLGIRTSIENFPTEIIGMVMASYFLGLLIGARYGSYVVAHSGHIRAFATFASMMSITALLHVLFISPLLWMVVRMLSGICMAGMVMVTESWLNERAENTNRGRVLSLYMCTNYFASGCGQFLLPLADPSEYHLFSMVSIIFSLALIPVLISRSQAPLPTAPVAVNMRTLYRISPVGLNGAFASGFINASFFGLGPVYAREIGLSLSGISLFMALPILCGLLLQWPIGKISDRFDRRRVLAAVALGTCIACIAMALSPPANTTLKYILGGAYGLLAFTVYSISAAHTNDLAPREQLVQTASGLLTAYGLGAICGPLVAALVMGQIGPVGLFINSATISLLLALFVLIRTRKRKDIDAQQKKKFIPVPHQYTSKELYNAMRDSRDRAMAQLIVGRRKH